MIPTPLEARLCYWIGRLSSGFAWRVSSLYKGCFRITYASSAKQGTESGRSLAASLIVRQKQNLSLSLKGAKEGEDFQLPAAQLRQAE